MPHWSDPQEFADLANDSQSIKAAGLAHGDMVFMLYRWEGVREVVV